MKAGRRIPKNFKASKSVANYTTEIEASETVLVIQEMLRVAGASQVMIEHDETTKTPCAISFKIKTQHGSMPFHLAVDVQRTFQVLVRDEISPKFQTQQHAARVAWRQTHDLLRVLLSQVEAGLVDLEQVLIGFWQIDRQTLYEHLRDSHFSVPQLTEGEQQ
jgi:hypothetical protein